ncbi:MAG TPA: class I SAM-dependent methyltransferase [Cytophagaceae bacterium]|jgi:hypothetical protein|nr:class I SAM-dependent methyltransferase [Cytophagaceae bacterium]
MSFRIQDYTSPLQTPAILSEPLAWVGHIPFAFFLIEYLAPKVIVELGVHTGNSFNAFCQTVKKYNTATTCYGVDTWKGEEHAGYYEETVFQELSKYHAENYKGISVLLRKTFDEAAKDFTEGSIDLLHIDGLHTYEAVKNDYETWLPKMKNGGVIIFHDTQVRRGDFGVWKLWQEISSQYPSYEFANSHGLGVILIGSNPLFELFLQEINKLKFLQQYFPKLGDAIFEQYCFKTVKNSNDQLLAKITALEQELMALHAKAESMRLKNRIKRLIFPFK